MVDDKNNNDSTENSHGIPSRTYRPYSNNSNNAFLATLWKIRWTLGAPFAVRILPSCRVPPRFAATPLARVTIGDVLLLLPLILASLYTYESAIVSPTDTETSGGYATWAVLYTFLTANKANSIFFFVVGLPFERLIGLHKISCVVALILGCLHVRAARYLDGIGAGQEIWSYLLRDGENLTGSIGLGAMLLLAVTSGMPILRRWAFQLWLVSHIVLAMVTLVGLFLHEATLVIFVAIWWAVDLLVRYGIQAQCQYRIRDATVRVLSANDNTTATAADAVNDDNDKASAEPVVEIRMPKPCNYKPGQYVQIAIPEISIWEFHPVTISSAPHEKDLTLHLRPLGDWTERLVKYANGGGGNDATGRRRQVTIWMEGPYGNVAVDLDNDKKYKMALLISGGIGVTPMQSVGKSLLYQHYQEGRHLKYLRYVWSVRDPNMVTLMPPLAPETSHTYGVDLDFSRKSVWHRRQSSLVASKLETDDSSESNNNNNNNSSSKSKNRTRLPAVAQVDIHCTRGGAPADDEEAASSRYNWHSGRPDWDELFRQVRATAQGLGEHHVAVLGCGPTALLEELHGLCRAHSSPVWATASDHVVFDLHVEHFEL